MASVVKGMDKAMDSMNLERVSNRPNTPQFSGLIFRNTPDIRSHG